jgi:hypothetical protein
MERETPKTDAFKERVRSGSHPDYWKFCEEMERTIADAAELIAEIMRNEVNAEDECEKWLRAYAPHHLFPSENH